MIGKIDKTNNTQAVQLQPGWANEPTYYDLKKDYDAALPDHEKYVARLKKYRADLNGGKKIKAAPNRSSFQPKLIRKHSEWRYPVLEEPFLNTEDMFKVNPRTGEDEKGSEQNEIMLNYQISVKVDKNALVTKFVRAFEDEGTSIIKVGWDVEYKDQKVMVEKPKFASPEESVKLIQMGLANGEMSEEEAKQIMQSGQPMQIGTDLVEEVQSVMVENKPVYAVKNNEAIIVDPTCGEDLANAGFVVEEYETNMATLKCHEFDPETGKGYYHNLHLVNQRESEGEEAPHKRIYGEDKLENQFEYVDAARKKLIAYEYWGSWDIQGDSTLVPIVATWIGSVLIRLEENPFPHKKLPFVSAANLPVKNTWRGEPSGVLIADNQDQIGKMQRALNDMVSDRAIGQEFIDERLFASRVEKDNYYKGRTVLVRAGMNPEKSIYRKQVDQVDSTTINMIQFHEQQAEAITGVRAFGISSGGNSLGSSATGIRSALDATAKRELSALRRLSTMMCELGRLTIQMNQEFLSEQEVVRVTNNDFVTVNRKDIQGEFDLIVDVSTPEKDNEKAQDLGMILQTNAANMDPELAKIVLSKIVRLKKEPMLADAIEDFKSEPTEQETQAHEAQMAELAMRKELTRMQILELAKQIENYDASILEKTSRVAENARQTEMEAARANLYNAQAEKITSETDKIDQEFVDNHTKQGVMTDAEKIAESRLDKLMDREHEELAKESDHQRELEKLHLGSKLNAHNKQQGEQ